ncbi:14282_t:CDS:10 [Cetraspora pellucida]|uniref:14282_t:CDS:1 n=1 Tax=Cetraspora pellucida TaxID=1433469 RepID=A0ACA9KQ04_9GLOM|nr:14282_t:CDS:10 [Cetraspora pellucida]
MYRSRELKSEFGNTKRQLKEEENGQCDKEYEVEKIISWKKENGKDYYMIKWLGYDESHNTWEPIANLKNCTELLRDFKKFRATKRVTISDDDEYDNSASEEPEMITKRKESNNRASGSKKRMGVVSMMDEGHIDKIFKSDVDDERKNNVFSRPIKYPTQDEYGEPSNKTKNNIDHRLPAAIKYTKNRVASSSKVENDDPRRSNYVGLSSSPKNDVFNSSLVTDLKKENIETLSVSSLSENVPNIPKQESPESSKFELMCQKNLPPWSSGFSFELLSSKHKPASSRDQKANRKSDENLNTSATSIENNNREEFSQPMKKEHKESADLMDIDDQREPMLSFDTSVPVRVRADHQWCGRLYKKIIAENDCIEKLVKIRQTDKLVIEHVQPQKRLVKIIEHDAVDYGKESGNEPFYAIYLVSEPGERSNLHIESKELRKKEMIAVISLNSWVLFLIPSQITLCTQLRITRPKEPFIMLRYKKDKFPINYLMQWSSETLSDLEESNFVLIGKHSDDQISDFMTYIGASETNILDPHVDCILIYQGSFKRPPSPEVINYMDLRYKLGIKFYLIEEPGLIPNEILVSGGIVAITERALLKYDQILGNFKRFLDHNPNWELKIPTLILEKLQEKYLAKYNAHFYTVKRLCDEISFLVSKCDSIKYLLPDEIKNEVEIMTLDEFERKFVHICN